MQIAFLGNFRETYCSESHHANSLRSLGHHVMELQETKASGANVWNTAKDCDVFIWVHTHGWRTPGGNMRQILEMLKNKGVKTLTYHLDLWFGLDRQKDMKKDDVWNIQHFFTVDKLMADWFNENTQTKGHYIQAGVYDKECYIESDDRTLEHGKYVRENDIIFVGSKNYHSEWAYRPQLINWLSDTYKERFNLWGGDGLGVVRGEQLNNLYARTKIVIGDSLCINFDYPHYWSDRVYETLGRGGFIIHPYIKGMESHFTDKEHLVFYNFGDFDQLKGLIDYYLEHDEEREKIRLAGYEHVKNNHNYKVRWQQILNEI